MQVSDFVLQFKLKIWLTSVHPSTAALHSRQEGLPAPAYQISDPPPATTPSWLQQLELDSPRQPQFELIQDEDSQGRCRNGGSTLWPKSASVREWVATTTPQATMPSPQASIVTHSTSSSAYADENIFATKSRFSVTEPHRPGSGMSQPVPLYPSAAEFDRAQQSQAREDIYRTQILTTPERATKPGRFPLAAMSTPRRTFQQTAGLHTDDALQRNSFQLLSEGYKTPSPSPHFARASDIGLWESSSPFALGPFSSGPSPVRFRAHFGEVPERPISASDLPPFGYNSVSGHVPNDYPVQDDGPTFAMVAAEDFEAAGTRTVGPRLFQPQPIRVPTFAMQSPTSSVDPAGSYQRGPWTEYDDGIEQSLDEMHGWGVFTRSV